jgi:ABC-type nitrate/sulfonate/bicarbonate transport system ATPase subunit
MTMPNRSLVIDLWKFLVIIPFKFPNNLPLTVTVTVARAMYKVADIYLLDDPLSAVDAHVGRHLFDDCICGFLRGKTRVLVTHQLQYLHTADNIVILNNVSLPHCFTTYFQ